MLAVPRQRVCSHGDDGWTSAACMKGTNILHGGDTVEFGHMDVHEDDVIAIGDGFLDCTVAIDGQI